MDTQTLSWKEQESYYCNQDEGHALMASLDLSAAFDTVNIDLLLKRMIMWCKNLQVMKFVHAFHFYIMCKLRTSNFQF